MASMMYILEEFEVLKAKKPVLPLRGQLKFHRIVTPE
jgi:hypothetical protein